MPAGKYLSIFSRQMAAIVYIFPNSQNCACGEKDLRDTTSLRLGRKYINNSLHLARKYARYICPRTLSVPRSEQFSESVDRGKLM